ncbi:putative bacteriocin (plasmid) [Aliivibrio wodanis]|uniref:Putative bacteriocin n=1 Tax=Aliivibrio wodanis TaxID=80852 RepID=A0A090I8L8_9GAMM|nr:putative bacteriocin [Aliivibrio wodanis]
MFCLTESEILMVDGGGEGSGAPAGYGGGSYSGSNGSSNYPSYNNGGRHSNSDLTNNPSVACLTSAINDGLAAANVSLGSRSSPASAATAGVMTSFGSMYSGGCFSMGPGGHN